MIIITSVLDFNKAYSRIRHAARNGACWVFFVGYI